MVPPLPHDQGGDEGGVLSASEGFQGDLSLLRGPQTHLPRKGGEGEMEGEEDSEGLFLGV